VIACTFDFGQTLAELDHELLAARVAERGERVEPRRLAEQSPAAWRAYGAAKQRGLVGREAWCALMRTLLTRSGLSEGRAGVLSDWLFDEQPRNNLWRRPIAGMFELVGELGRAAVPVGIVSNSEGHLAELVRELGHAGSFQVIADSGKLGLEKPDPRIFHWAAERLEVPASALVHVGDAWDADVRGVLAAGGRAVWFLPTDARELPRGVRTARSAIEVRDALLDLGVPLPTRV
jgi:FMN phosphatase YigB (HAD superfamily)